MAQRVHITIADSVIKEIEKRMKKEEATNKSEFIEELIREGLKND